MSNIILIFETYILGRGHPRIYEIFKFFKKEKEFINKALDASLGGVYFEHVTLDSTYLIL